MAKQYEITFRVDFHDPDGDNYEEVGGLWRQSRRHVCRGSVTPAEPVSVRIKSSIGGDYLPLAVARSLGLPL